MGGSPCLICTFLYTILLRQHNEENLVTTGGDYLLIVDIFNTKIASWETIPMVLITKDFYSAVMIKDFL